MTSLLQDFRFALRMLVKNPGFTVIAVLALALGIGANTGIFSIVNSVLLRPLPYRDPGRLISVWQKIPGEDRVQFSAAELATWGKQAQVFENLGASVGNGFTLTGRGEPVLFRGQVATPSLFQVLGVPAALGRTFLPQEGEAGHDHEVLLSDGLWRERFGADPKIVGQAVALNGEHYTVVGVMPASFDYPGSTYRVWVPAALSTGLFAKFPDVHFLRVIGRLKPGIGDARLQAELEAVAKSMAEHDPNANRKLVAAPLQQAATGEIRRPLIVIMGAVAFVLLIACANVANLMLARATSRRREMAVRAAMGAGRLRLMRQVLVEAVMISALGGALGLVVAVWSLQSLTAWTPANVPGIQNAQIDTWALAFTLLVCLMTGLLFGLAPALTSWNSDWNESLKQGSRGAGGGAGSRLRGALVAGEIALAMVLLASAGLMLRSFARLQSVNPGFRSEHVLTAGVSLRETHYPDAMSIANFDRRLLEKIRALPGVEFASTNTGLPFSGQGWGNSVEIEGHPSRKGQADVVQIQCISSQYFSSMGIALQRGRDIREEDNATSPPVAIIAEGMAKRFWPGEDPIGKRLQVDGPMRTVMGVVADVKKMGLDTDEAPQLYVPYLQLNPNLLKFLGRGLYLAVRSPVDAASLSTAIRAQVHALDPEMALDKVVTMDRMLYESVAQPRFRTRLIGIFSGLALVLACIGIYGVMSYTVTQRTREMGLRMALGAGHDDVLRLVLGKALGMALAGIALGLALSFAVTRVLHTLLFGVSEHDPVTFIAVPVVLTVVALAASYLPARRATRVDPMISLRYE